ncbi:hypothetical protein GOB86_12635 [Acetobacter lambici]|uniref:Uncharacterized protein n=1 Tax=Acetobacter lambici TaxID=1332824 RepID=A0ABT1F1S0_9PROT|nr:hypothetical protein [Acetobacter lambici]MCP1242761.1 hypothetical protein [Acetobacter lambici]MCP1258931.1 hypothetical protein [Acetobacter lambici]NHO57891.1 hypothetical protein [Acetobacter lambici]
MGRVVYAKVYAHMFTDLSVYAHPLTNHGVQNSLVSTVVLWWVGLLLLLHYAKRFYPKYFWFHFIWMTFVPSILLTCARDAYIHGYCDRNQAVGCGTLTAGQIVFEFVQWSVLWSIFALAIFSFAAVLACGRKLIKGSQISSRPKIDE